MSVSREHELPATLVEAQQWGQLFAGACIGAAFGSPFPPAVYIGHPGWKDAGGRAGYSLASGVVIGIFCLLGLFGVLDALLPVPAIVPA